MHKWSSLKKHLFAMLLLVFMGGVMMPGISYAVNPDEVLEDPVLEERARKLSANLRCLVCQNQSIDDSDASLAKDLRVLLRQRLVTGDSDEQVIDYVVSRYGEFVLLKPRFGLHTLILWSLPAILILIGFILAIIKFKKPEPVTAAHARILSDDENKRIAKLLNETD